MKPIIFITALLLSGVNYAQTTWEKIDINNALRVSFPGKPVKTEPGNGQSLYILKHADSTANYIVGATDLGMSMGIDEATLTEEMEKEESWEQAKSAFIGSMGAEVTLIKDEMTTIKGNKGLQLTLAKKMTNGDTNNITVFIFIKGTVSYNMIFVNRAGKASAHVKDQFFDSIEMK